jgi:hypothetical protein
MVYIYINQYIRHITDELGRQAQSDIGPTIPIFSAQATEMIDDRPNVKGDYRTREQMAFRSLG